MLDEFGLTSSSQWQRQPAKLKLSMLRFKLSKLYFLSLPVRPSEEKPLNAFIQLCSEVHRFDQFKYFLDRNNFDSDTLKQLTRL